MTARLAVFDCDGTLVDGQAGICDAMERAFADHGLAAPDRSLVRRIVGLSLPVALRKLVPQADEASISSLAASYKAAFRQAREAGELSEPLYPGIAALLDRLRDAGWQLGVATGKSQRGLAHVLALHGLSDHFVTLQTADTHPSKPHPAMLEAAMFEAATSAQQTVMIGDTAYDMAMAATAGARAVGVDWGYHEPAELLAAGANAIARSAEMLEELLR